ncbi:MAG: hypothetical protein HYX37_17275 [Rhizobiales bacterium]|nr:hypothetical protein [Hyphomicrobiales bacterium]
MGCGRPAALAAVAAVVASGAAFAQQSDTPVVKPVGQIHDKLRMAKEREGAALAGEISDVASRYARMKKQIADDTGISFSMDFPVLSQWGRPREPTMPCRPSSPRT